MLQALVRRMQARWPAARIRVLTLDAMQLTRHCPGVEPLPAMGRYRWLPQPRPPGVRAALRAAGRTAPVPLARAQAGWERRHDADPDVRELVGALLDADAFMLAGRGGLADAFVDDGLQVLALLRAAIALGLPTAALGQGLGPAQDPRLRARARRVLPRLELIGVREGRAAPALLAQLAVDPGRVVVTGDDAIVRALPPATGTRGSALGVNVRATGYSGIGPDQLPALGAAIRAAAERVGAPLVALPIMLDGPEADMPAIAEVTGSAAPSGVEDVDSLVAATSGCRAVVAGSYHAVVFALAAGIPTVALWGSDYYRAKLEGAAEQFGPACTPLAIAGDDLPARLSAAVDAAWSAGADVRAGLVASAERQAAAAQAAFDRFAERIERRVSG